MSREYKFESQYIQGQWRSGASTTQIMNINPYTQETLLEISAAHMRDVDEAYSSAHNAYKSWSKTTGEDRSALLQRVMAIIQVRREEIITWLIKESGSTRLKANIEVDASLSLLAAAVDYPKRVKHETLPTSVDGQESSVYRQALGVIGVISPWNFPFHLSMRSVVPAIVLGNTVVLKPATDTPVSGGLIIAKIFEEAGLEVGVLNVVVGTGSEIGDYFVQHDIPKFISFTGSTQVGKRVGQLALSCRMIKRVALELGGNAPLVVLHDADLDKAVNIAALGRFLHQGQICMSTNRVIVDTRIHDVFVEKLIEKVKTLRYGDPDQFETLIGPTINQNQINHIQAHIQQGVKDGAKLVLSGEIQRNVIPPHIFIEVSPESALAREESFGPVLPIIRARDEEHALFLANDTEFGLSSAVCTEDLDRGLQFALQIDAGMTHVNDITVEDQTCAPFGGEKNSGLGRFNDRWIIEEFTRTHWITVQKTVKQYPV